MLGHKPPCGSECLITPTDSLAGGATCYFCHAGMLEIAVPIEVNLGLADRKWLRPTAIFWGGQCAVRDASEMKVFFRHLSQATGVPPEKYCEAYRSQKRYDKKTIQRMEFELVDLGKAISTFVSQAYHLQEHLKSSDTIGVFSNAIAKDLTKTSGQQDSRGASATLQAMLENPVRQFVRAYRLGASVIYRLEFGDNPNRPCRAIPFVGAPQPDLRPIDVDTSLLEFSAQEYTTRKARVISATQAREDASIRRLVGAAVGEMKASAVCLVPFQGVRTAPHVWVSTEDQQRPWYVGTHELQPEFASIFAYTAVRLSSSMDIHDLLRETEEHKQHLEAKEHELRQGRAKTQSLIFSMAHLVSRPILELDLASMALVSNPHSPYMRDHFRSCLFELRRAARGFQSFVLLTTGEDQAKLSEPSNIDVLAVVETAIKRIDSLSRLKRRPLNLLIQDVLKEDHPYTWARQDAVTEIIENLLHNAIKYSLGGRPVDIQVARSSSGTEVSITSYGCPIPPDERDRIFDLGYRSLRARTHEVEGSGIGLWVARKRAEMEGATLALQESEPFGFVDGYHGQKIPRHRNVFRLTLRPAR